jgi:hypothetical protein
MADEHSKETQRGDGSSEPDSVSLVPDCSKASDTAAKQIHKKVDADAENESHPVSKNPEFYHVTNQMAPCDLHEKCGHQSPPLVVDS